MVQNDHVGLRDAWLPLSSWQPGEGSDTQRAAVQWSLQAVNVGLTECCEGSAAGAE